MHTQASAIGFITGAAMYGAQGERIEKVVALVSKEKNVSPQILLHPSRCRADAARARQLAMYLAHVVLGQSLTAIGNAFGRDRTTVSYACGLIEDMRDDRQFDDEVTRLESILETEGDQHGH